MMNSRSYFLAAALVTLAACSNDNETDNSVESGLVPLEVSASINKAKTRVTNDSQWQKGDMISVNATSGELEYTAKNYKLVDGTSNFEPVDPIYDAIYYGAADGEFSAYYPCIAYQYLTDYKTISGDIISQETEQKKMSNKRIDFMYAKATGTKNSPAVNFKFDHKMSKLVIRLKAGVGFQDAWAFTSWYDLIFSSKSPNLHSKVTFDPKEGTITPRNAVNSLAFLYQPTNGIPRISGEDVTIDGTKYGQFTYILCPEEQVPGGLEFALHYVTKDITYTTTLFTDKSETEMVTEAGKEYVYTVTVNKTGLEVTNATIKPWIPAELPNDGNVDASL
ncbi:fimbrillin family protein [Bacteroides faecium]|uniref:Fimbrillin family protein n=1 Tax=Bacteroides faecium TaxID=2715212 RepID=A0A6H0KT48_9BACE|nr:fimbrillin family protein [Bacteroides faecium]QIU96369.1 fimbrillin family protein [Bacteroides faecium]